MNEIIIRFGGIVITITVLSFIFSSLFDKDLVKKVFRTIVWLLKISFFDLTGLLIFVKPLKKYKEQVGILLWLILVCIIGKYLIIEQPKITEIFRPYLPFIGYMYYLSVLLIIKFILRISKKVN